MAFHLAHIRLVRQMNARPLVADGGTVNNLSHWLEQLNNPAWNPQKENIKNMFDYGCAMSGNYLQQVLSGARE